MLYQDGKPYILSVDAHQPANDPRTQGYNVLAHTTFSSFDDVKYYDEQCEAHKSKYHATNLCVAALTPSRFQSIRKGKGCWASNGSHVGTMMIDGMLTMP